MISLLCQTAFISLSISLAISLNIQVQPQLFQVNQQKQINLICSTFNQIKRPMQRVVQLSLRKLAGDGTWADVAVLRHDGSAFTSVDNNMATACGNKEDVSKSYLNVSWPAATANVFGKYRCDAVGYNNMWDFVVDNSVELEVTGVTQEAFQLYKVIEKSERTRKEDDMKIMKTLESNFYELQEFDNKTIQSMNSRLDKLEEFNKNMNRSLNLKFVKLQEFNKSMIASLNSQFEKFQDYMDNKILGWTNSLNSKLSNLQEFDQRIQSFNSKFDQLQDNKTLNNNYINIPMQEDVSWPEGNFILPMPNTGCPQTPLSWDDGQIKSKLVKSETFEEPKYATQPDKEDGWVSLRFCGLKESPNRNMTWPSGSYCIYSYMINSCPDGFRKTHVSIIASSTAMKWPPIPDALGNSVVYSLYFCCRYDESPNVPITLPTSSPFYLVRHRGTCQKVKNMNVKQDVVVVAIKFGRLVGDLENLPDANTNPLRVELCFYSKV